MVNTKLIVGLCAHLLTFPDFLIGPANWGGVCQTGKKQTPIDINSANTTWKKDFDALVLRNYSSTPNVNFIAGNNGHAFSMSFPDGTYTVTGAGITDVYHTVQFHLHWGSTNTQGSEHFLDGKQYAAEVSDIVFKESSHGIMGYFGQVQNQLQTEGNLKIVIKVKKFTNSELKVKNL